MQVDVTVIGGGIVGLASARAIAAARPEARVVLLDKEERLAAHQTGRNSGVIHSGIYYKPGSKKAELCRAGRRSLLDYCVEHDIPHEVCGKVVVATTADEAARLPGLLERAAANGVKAEAIDRARLAELEPHVAATASILVHDTGIVDFVAMCEAMGDGLRAAGTEIRLGTAVTGLAPSAAGVEVRTAGDAFESRVVVNCAGLHSDTFANAEHGSPRRPDVRIVPFRGEYYELAPGAQGLVRNLVYPVPDPRFPFLGVHFTRMVHGGVHAGPNAVLAMAREGYTWGTVDRRELAELLRFPGMRKLARAHWRMGLGEIHRSLSKRAFVRAAQRLVPEVQEADFHASPAGVRAQALGRDGALYDDFVFVERPRVVHVVNAPSPAATASLAIGDEVAARALSQLGPS